MECFEGLLHPSHASLLDASLFFFALSIARVDFDRDQDSRLSETEFLEFFKFQLRVWATDAASQKVHRDEEWRRLALLESFSSDQKNCDEYDEEGIHVSYSRFFFSP